MKCFFKYLGIIFLSLLGILLLLLLFIQTPPFKTLLKNILIEEVNKNLADAELSLGDIHGNLFKTLSVNNILLTTTSHDTLFFLDTLQATYSLSSLKNHKLLIKEINAVRPIIKLTQDDSGTWNFAKILPLQDTTNQTSGKEPFLKHIALDHIAISQGDISLHTWDNQLPIPKFIEDITINASFVSYQKDFFQITLHTLTFHTREPDFSLIDGEFHFFQRDSTQRSASIILQSAHSFVSGSVIMDTLSTLPADLTLTGNPLTLAEFDAFIPESPVIALPKITFTLHSQREKGTLDLALNYEGQTITTHLSLESLKPLPIYQADISIDHLNLKDWIKDFSLETDFTSQFHLEGRGIELETFSASLMADIEESSIQGFPIQPGTISAEKIEDTITFAIDYNSHFGDFLLHGTLTQLFTLPHYSISASVTHLNPNVLFPETWPDSDINLTLALQGVDFNPSTLEATVSLQSFEPSRIETIRMDTVDISATYHDSVITLHRGKLINSMVSLDVSGKAGLKGDTDLNFLIQPKNLSPLATWLTIKPIQGEGVFHGNLSGKYPNFSLETTMHLKNIRYQTLSLDKLMGTVDLQYLQSMLSGSANLIATTLSVNEDFTLDTLHLKSFGDETKITNSLSVKAEDIALSMDTDVLLDTAITLKIPQFEAKIGPFDIKTPHQLATVIFSDNKIALENIYLKGKYGNFFIQGDIRQNFKDFSTLEVGIDSLDLSLLDTFAVIPYPVAGMFSMSGLVKGTLNEPEIILTAEIAPFAMERLFLEKTSLSALLKNNRLEANLAIQKMMDETLMAFAEIPFYILLDSGKIHIPGNEPIDINMTMKQFNLSFLEVFNEHIHYLQGTLNGDFQIKNTLNNPKLTGKITLNEGQLSIPLYGISYPMIRANITFDDRKITLEEFYIKGGDGQLVLTGNTVLAKPLLTGLESFYLRAKGDQFTALGNRDIFIFTDLDITLQGTPSHPVFDGTITIPRARINLDALTFSSPSTSIQDEPLLIQALKEETDTTTIPTTVRVTPAFLDNLSGQLHINIPRNTWLRGKNLNIEIAGEVDFIKQNKQMQFVGSVNTLRGTYEFYNNKFVFREGIVTFDGGTEINPTLNFTIDHPFKDSNRMERTLSITLSGKLDNPEISFLLDNEMITETDAFSYLLFGRSSNDLSFSQQNEVRDQLETSLAASLLAYQLGAQLTQEIGKRLDLDVIEFNGGENWKQASIYIGKYFTDKLFLSYEKEFILGETREIVPDKVSAEYELNRNFFIQATRGDEQSTGIDIVWKYTKR
ncbi:MAG: translocation/assembly module TamB domain-containing protein [Candidatus Marinimicrobia bacterium]|nr:translocation/assembly module TamB domain-containing protein [Candidatus Neomarinimicrobiota bacterium]